MSDKAGYCGVDLPVGASTVAVKAVPVVNLDRAVQAD